MSNKPTQAKIDYYHIMNGSRGRTTSIISVSQHLNGATTESAVLNYLRRMHPGEEIELMSVDWE